MSLTTHNFIESIIPKKLTISDGYLDLKKEIINTEEGFNYVAYNALKDVNDIKTNNFSNLFLSKKQKNSNILELKEKIETGLPDFVSTLSFFKADESPSNNPEIWIAIDKSYDAYEMDTTSSSFKLIDNITDNHYHYTFRVQCIDEQYCRISHTFGDTTYYFTYDNGFKVSMFPKNEKFIYFLENNKLFLFYPTKDETNTKNILNKVVCKKNNGEWFLELEKVSSATNLDSENAIIFVNNNRENLNYSVDASWITYDRTNNITKIDLDRSNLNLETQFLLHHEYSDKENKINLIPLKNNLTYQGTVTNGTNLTISNNGKTILEPLVDFRNYHSINSGVNQETGSENITLTFTFTDQVYHINEGDDCIFSIPALKDGDIFSPLYPYKKLNINDSAFVLNGAFASNIPFLADKFRKLQNNTSINNCTYHCTWLYQPKENVKPVWLDRYYYPDKIKREDALISESTDDYYDLSFENNLDKFYFSKEETENLTELEKEQLNEIKTKLEQIGYIDKISDLNIEEGTTYKYSRLSDEMVKEVVSTLDDVSIKTVQNQKTNTTNLKNRIVFNKENWLKISADDFNNTRSISFNTDLLIDPAKKIGIQLFGSDYKHGFNIQNRKDLCPFTYYATGDTLYMLNNNFKVCNFFKIEEKYNEKIIYFIEPGPFENIYLFTEKSLIIFDYDLRLKNKIDLKSIIKNGIDNLADLDSENDTNNVKNYLEFLQNNTAEIATINAIFYNGNLYTVINNGNAILKIIFNPENEDDKVALKESYTSCRILRFGDYKTNFVFDESKNLVQTSHKIKKLFINDDILFAFNYDVLSLAPDGDTIYGIIKDNAESDEVEDDNFYIFNQSLSKLVNFSSASKFAEFVSDVSIDSVAFGSNGTFALVRGFDTDNDKKTLEIYDKSKTKIYNYPLNGYDKIISLNYYRYIDETFEEHDVFIAVLSLYGFIGVVEYQIDQELIKTYIPNLDADVVSGFNGIINSNKFITKLNENKLYFNVFMSDNKPPISYIWDLVDAQNGWYNINVNIDSESGAFNIKINDKIVAELELDSKYSHYNPLLFNSNYYYGILGKRYGTTLNEILDTNYVYDPYVCKNCKAENTTLYTRNLSYYEYQASRLYFSKINPLTITLPCGIRNGIEEIVRYFKYSKPGSMSSNIKINIAGLTEIESNREKELLRKSILDSLTENDYLINVKEIEFI